MVLLVDLSALDEGVLVDIVRSDVLTREEAITLLRTKKLDYGEIEKKQDLLGMLPAKFQTYIIKEHRVLSLPKDEFSVLLSFSDHDDRDALALVSKNVKDLVEYFAYKKIKCFMQTNRVDSEWRQRLQQHAARYGIVTFRKQLRCIPKVYIRLEEVNGCIDLLKLPTGNEMIVKDLNASIHLWNYRTKKYVTTLHQGPEAHSGCYGIHFCQDYIVLKCYASYFEEWFKVFTMEGEILHTFAIQEHTPYYVTTLGNKLYYSFFKSFSSFALVEIDVASGQPTGLESQVLTGRTHGLVSVGSWILALVGDDKYMYNPQDENTGIYVLKGTDLTTASHFSGRFRDVTSFDNKIAAMDFDGKVAILELTNGGLLQEIRSVPEPRSSRIESIFLHDNILYTASPYEPFKRHTMYGSERDRKPVSIQGIDYNSALQHPFPAWTSEKWTRCALLQVVTDGDKVLHIVRVSTAANEFACVVLEFPKP